jgi:hypothetical protein
VGAGGRYMFDFVATASKQGKPTSQLVLRLESIEGLGSDTARACHFFLLFEDTANIAPAAKRYPCLVALFSDVLLEI